MDAKVAWHVNSDPESLVTAVISCRDALLEFAKRKHRTTHAEVTAFDVYVQGKLLEMLSLSTRWVPTVQITDLVRPRDRNPTLPVLVATCGDFRVHHAKGVNRDVARIIIEVGHDFDQRYYGDVELVNHEER